MSKHGSPADTAAGKKRSLADPADRIGSAAGSQAPPAQPSQGAAAEDAAAAQTQPDTQPTGSPEVQDAVQAISRVVCTTALSPGSQQTRSPVPGRRPNTAAALIRPPQGPAQDSMHLPRPEAAVQPHAEALLPQAGDAAGASLPCSFFHLSLDFGDTQPPEPDPQALPAPAHPPSSAAPASRPLEGQQPSGPSQALSPSQTSLPVWHGGRTGHILLTQPTQSSQPGAASSAPGAPLQGGALSPTPSLPSPQPPRGPQPSKPGRPASHATTGSHRAQPMQGPATKQGPARRPQRIQQPRAEPRQRAAAVPRPRQSAAAAVSSMVVADSQDAPSRAAAAQGASPAASSPSACVADSPPAAACRMPMHDQSLPQPGTTLPPPPALAQGPSRAQSPAAGAGPVGELAASPYAPQPAERAKRRHARAASQQPLRTKTCAPGLLRHRCGTLSAGTAIDGLRLSWPYAWTSEQLLQRPQQVHARLACVLMPCAEPMLPADSLWHLCRRPQALRRQERRLDITQRPAIIRQGAHLRARKRLRHLLQRGASGHAAGTALTESQVLPQGEAGALPCNKHLGCDPPPICAALQA